MVVIQVMQVDEAGNERSKVLEYELPVNFKFDPDLSPVFVAVEIIKQQYLGLYFESVDEKQKFIAALQDLYLKLTINSVDLGAIKDHCQKELDQEYQAQLAEAISVTDLLSGQDQNKQAQELRKVLILAGLKVETELADPETVKLIAGVIAKFDPKKSIDEDDFLFESRFEVFESI